MRARWLLNLLLSLIVVALATLAYLRPGLDEAESVKRLSPLSPAQVQRVEIERPEQEPITMVRGVNGWQLTAPINLPVNPFRIEPLLQLRRAVSHASFAVDDNGLAQYGLAVPRVKLSLDGEQYAFGDTEPLNGYRYVLVDGTVNLLSDRIHHYLLMSPYDFASLELLSPQSELIELRFNNQVIDDELTLTAWSEAHARRVSRYSEPESDVERLSLVLADGTTLQIDILLHEPEFVLGIVERGVRYHFTEEEGERLMQMRVGGDA